MKAIFGIIFIFLSMSSIGYGALPPLYQTSSELKSVLTEHDLGNYLPSGEPIIEIRKKGKGYLILTNKHSLQADIVYEPMNIPGPARFHVEYREAIPLASSQ